MKKWIIRLLVFSLPFFVLSAVGPYTDNGDGTVTDTTTNLRWQKCSRGQTADATCSGAATPATWSTALQYCNSLSLASKTWRLPALNELKSLIDNSVSNPSIKTAIFPATVTSYYWSSSTNVGSVNFAWYVYFIYGDVDRRIKTTNYYVRCVTTGP